MKKDEFSRLIISLVDDFGVSQKKISDKTGFSRTVLSHAYNRNYDKFALRADMPPKLFEAFPELNTEDDRPASEIEEENKQLKEKLIEAHEKLIKAYEENKVTKEEYEEKITKVEATLQLLLQKLNSLDQ